MQCNTICDLVALCYVVKGKISNTINNIDTVGEQSHPASVALVINGGFLRLCQEAGTIEEPYQMSKCQSVHESRFYTNPCTPRLAA